MSDNLFVDTNILVYSVADDLHKRSIAENLLLQEEIVVSPQVISEFVAVTLRKQILEQPKVIEYATQFLNVFHVTATTAHTVTSALKIMTMYRFSYWDSLSLPPLLKAHAQLSIPKICKMVNALRISLPLSIHSNKHWVTKRSRTIRLQQPTRGGGKTKTHACAHLKFANLTTEPMQDLYAHK